MNLRVGLVNPRVGLMNPRVGLALNPSLNFTDFWDNVNQKKSDSLDKVKVIIVMDRVVNTPFYHSATLFNQQVRTWDWKSVLFPRTKFITEGDDFFREIWRAIDKSKSYVWIVTYAMDKSISANTTISKLIDARRRGVHTVLFVDDVQQWMEPGLLEMYRMAGGVFVSLNPQWKMSSFTKFKDKEIFRRHHEKIFVSDEVGVIGSSNLEAGYASTKFGSWVFKDLNLYSENMNLKDYRDHIYSIASFYNIPLATDRSNQGIREELDKLYPNSTFYKKQNYRLLRAHQPQVREIQTEVLKQIKEAKKSILIVQPYYYPIRSFEEEVENALARGVQVELITSAKRDQPVYKFLKNGLLLRKLIKKGLKVYELHQKILHSKAYVVDEKVMNIGSFNNDRWSWKINNETNINIESRHQYEKLREYFKNLKTSSIQANPYPYMSFTRKVKMLFWEKFMYLSECLMSKTKEFNLDRFLGHSHSNPPDS